MIRSETPAATVIKARMQSLNNEIDKLKDEILNRDKLIMKEKETKIEVNEEIDALNKKIKAIENQKMDFEMNSKILSESLEVIKRNANKYERIRNVLQNRRSADNDRIDQLTEQITISIVNTEEARKKYDELLRKVSLSEHLLKESKSGCLSGEIHIHKLESDLKQAISKIKAFEIHIDQVAEREVYYNTRIHSLSLQVKEADERAQLAELETTRLKQEIDIIKEEINRHQQYYFNSKKELQKNGFREELSDFQRQD